MKAIILTDAEFDAIGLALAAHKAMAGCMTLEDAQEAFIVGAKRGKGLLRSPFRDPEIHRAFLKEMEKAGQ